MNLQGQLFYHSISKSMKHPAVDDVYYHILRLT